METDYLTFPKFGTLEKLADEGGYSNPAKRMVSINLKTLR